VSEVAFLWASSFLAYPWVGGIFAQTGAPKPLSRSSFEKNIRDFNFILFFSITTVHRYYSKTPGSDTQHLKFQVAHSSITIFPICFPFSYTLYGLCDVIVGSALYRWAMTTTKIINS
jgi:hypothetical protein